MLFVMSASYVKRINMPFALMGLSGPLIDVHLVGDHYFGASKLKHESTVHTPRRFSMNCDSLSLLHLGVIYSTVILSG